MKKFEYRLDRVLDWRRSQVQVEEIKLERLYAGLRAIESRLEQKQLAAEQSRTALLASGPVTGAELRALENFRKASAAECAKLQESATASRRQIDQQRDVLAAKRRDVKLLEFLRAHKLAAWNAELAREADREAAELHLAKFASRSPHRDETAGQN